MQQGRDGVSILITSYNYAQYIGRAIESALAQDVPGLEVVVVDNASTDDSWNVIARAAERDRRIRAYRNDSNIGMVGNHNRAIDLASHDRILFLSADDYLLPGHVERVLAEHRRNPQADYVYATHLRIDEQGRFLNYCDHPGLVHAEYAGGRNEFAELLAHDCYMCFPTTLFRRDECLHGVFREGVVAGDLDLYLQLAARGATFAFVNVPGVAIALHAAETSGKERYVATGRQLRDHVILLETYLTDETQPLYRGRERSILRLLQTKAAIASQHPQASEELNELRPRIDALVQRLAASESYAARPPQEREPIVSVVLFGTADVAALCDCIEMSAGQIGKRDELIVVDRAEFDATTFLEERTRGLPAKILRIPPNVPDAVAMNDAVRFASGDIVTYLRPGVRWPPNHIARMRSLFSQPNTNVVFFSLRYPHGAIEATQLQELAVADSVPVEALVHRRVLLDRLGGFDHRFGPLYEAEFVVRLLAASTIVSDSGPPLSGMFDLRRSASALQDPSGYLAALQSLYASYKVPDAMQQRRKPHVERLTLALNEALSARSVQTQQRLEFAIRGDGAELPR